jgi:hypothetical protein
VLTTRSADRRSPAASSGAPGRTSEGRGEVQMAGHVLIVPLSTSWDSWFTPAALPYDIEAATFWSGPTAPSGIGDCPLDVR